MSLNRYATKRDANEPAIRKRFARHGWHTEQVSGAGMPDMLVWMAPGAPRHRGPCTLSALVDVKMAKGKVTPEQVRKWTALRAKGIPVYVVRTEADVDALVVGNLQPWEPEAVRAKTKEVADALSRRSPEAKDEARRRARAGYTPPRSKPMDAAKEADETFAPPSTRVDLNRVCLRGPSDCPCPGPHLMVLAQRASR